MVEKTSSLQRIYIKLMIEVLVDSVVETTIENGIHVLSITVERVNHNIGILSSTKVIIHGNMHTNSQLRELAYFCSFDAQFMELCGGRPYLANK
jgi:hypothetical protein